MKTAYRAFLKTLLFWSALSLCLTHAEASSPAPLEWFVNGTNFLLRWPTNGWTLSVNTNSSGNWMTVSDTTVSPSYTIYSTSFDQTISNACYRLESADQTALYSSNSFGYANYPLVSNSVNSLINPFRNGSNSIAEVLPSAQNQTIVGKGPQDSPTEEAFYSTTSHGWFDAFTLDPSTMLIGPTEAFWYAQGDPNTPATLTLFGESPVWIYQQPTNQAAPSGNSVSFFVGVNATVPSYQWQFQGTNLANNGHVSGANSSTLTIANISSEDGGDYAVVVNSSYGSVTSSVATLSPIAPFFPSEPRVYIFGTNLIWNFTNGFPGTQFIVVATTNLSLPLTNWPPVQTNTFDNAGTFQLVLPVEPDKSNRFYSISIQP